MMIWILSAAGFVLLYMLLICPARSGRGKKFFMSGRWYAHRGLHDENVCENTLQAFEAAVKMGYGIELDVHLTGDEQLIVFHDDTLQRLCGRENPIEDMTLDQIKQVTLPDGQGIPLLRQALYTIAGRVPVIVEIKSARPGNCRVSEKLYEMLKAYEGPCCVQSFDPLQLRWFKKHAPRVIRGQLAQKARLKKSLHPRYLAQMLAGNLVFNRLSSPDYVAYRQEDTKKFCYRLMRRVYHIPTAVWTVRSETEEKKMEGQCDAVIFENFRPEIKGGKNHE